MAYGFSVFWVPLGRAVAVARGAPKPIACPGDATSFAGKLTITGHALFATDCDWTQFDLGWMYGGGFATVPAYLADLFGVQYVGAIHGRLLTAWSTAGIVGPVLVNYLHNSRVAAGVPRDHVYDVIFYALTGLLVVGLAANALIRPVAEKWFIGAPSEHEPHAAKPRTSSFGIGHGGFDAEAAVAWALVGVPLAWGVYMTLLSAAKIFQ